MNNTETTSRTRTIKLTELEADNLFYALSDHLDRLVTMASDHGEALTAEERLERDALKRVLKKLRNA